MVNPAELVKIARQAQQQAYAPYSEFRVGAALLTAAGHIYTGANIENASYGLTMCAERIAVFKAVMAGEKQMQSIAVAGSGTGYIFPCGACLQVLVEFAPYITVIVANEKDEIQEYNLNELLPQGFALPKDSREQTAASRHHDPSRRGK